MKIEVEPTPNPTTLKFVPSIEVLGNQTIEVLSKEEADISPLAQRLFDVSGVAGILLGPDFVSVTCEQNSDWTNLKPMVLNALTDFFESGDDLLNNDSEVKESNKDNDHGEDYDPKDADLVRTIKELLDTRIRPAVAMDGGDVLFRGFREGVVYLNMRGACAGCPISAVTLKHGIENLLRHFIPDVHEVCETED